MPPVRFHPNQIVTYVPSRGRPIKATVKYDYAPTFGKTLVRLAGDVFDVYVRTEQLQQMSVPTSQMTVKQLIAEARQAELPGWDEMSRAELEEAIIMLRKMTIRSNNGHVQVKQPDPFPDPAPPVVQAPQRPKDPPPSAVPPPKAVKPPERPTQVVKTIKKKRAAKKKMIPAANPFRPESNSFVYCQVLKKGGTRRKLATEVARQVILHPWSKKNDEVNELAEIDKRLILVSQQLAHRFGWTVERSGRGIEGFIKVIPPRKRV